MMASNGTVDRSVTGAASASRIDPALVTVWTTARLREVSRSLQAIERGGERNGFDS